MSRDDAHRIFEKLAAGYLARELSPADRKAFEEALKETPELRDRLEDLQRIWEGVDQLATQNAYDMDAEWVAFEKRLPAEETPVPVKSGFRNMLFRVAAVLLIGMVLGLGGYMLVRMTGTATVIARDEAVEVQLEDGSVIILNTESRIRYKKQFGDQKRSIRLSGEAWFDVARDTVRPFVIDAGTAVVEVLGTSFNVHAYQDDPLVEITVESGVVALSAKSGPQEQIVLKAGNSGSYNRESRDLVLQASSDPNNIAWKTRELYFENSSLKEVAALVSKVYHVDVVIRNPALNACPITVSFSKQSLESVLNVIASTLDLEISREGARIILDGSGC